VQLIFEPPPLRFLIVGKILVPTPPNLNKRDFCEAILRCAGETLDRTEFQLGLTKVHHLDTNGALADDNDDDICWLDE
jgi:hypothetical protein